MNGYDSAARLTLAVLVAVVAVAAPLCARDETSLASRCDDSCGEATDGTTRGHLRRSGECVCVPVPTPPQEPAPEPEISAEVTAYIPTCKGCSGILYNGERANPDTHTVAANLDHWRIGECVALDLPDEGWTTYTVRDTGGALDRADQIDMLVATRAEAKAWGRRTIRVRRVPCEPTP